MMNPLLLNHSKKILLALMLFALCTVLVFPDFAFASEGSGGGLPYEGPLGDLRDSVTGPVAYTAAIAGIVGSLIALIFGSEINAFIRTVLLLVLIIALLVGAQNWMAGTFGTGADLLAGDSIAYFKLAISPQV